MRPLRFGECTTEVEVRLCHVERRGRRHVGDLVRHEPVHGPDRGIHALLLLLQAGLERLQQLHGNELTIPFPLEGMSNAGYLATVVRALPHDA